MDQAVLPTNLYSYWMCRHDDIDSFRWFLRTLKECDGILLHACSNLLKMPTDLGKLARNNLHLFK